MENARRQHWDSLPAWTQNLSVSEVTQNIETLVREMSLHFTLALVASVEGLLNHQIRLYVLKKPRDPRAKALRKKFRRLVENKENIRFEIMLDSWKRNDPRMQEPVSRLKQYLQYRHWSIHYWNIPDPNDVYLLYEAMDKIIGFDLSV